MRTITYDPKRLDALLAKQDWSDLRLADEAGIDPKTLRNWRDRGNCSVGTASAVALALGVRTIDLAHKRRRRKVR